MADRKRGEAGKQDKTQQQQQQKSKGSKRGRPPGSTTSLGKRRYLRATQPKQQQQQQQQPQQAGQEDQQQQPTEGRSRSPSASRISSSEYGSQATPMRRASSPSDELVKVAILGAAGGIGQPLAMLLMLHNEYIQHLALYDLVQHVRGVALDVSHIDRQCRVSSHLGPDELADCVRGAKVIVIPAGLAQKPGMSRDDLFGSNAKIMYNLAKVCAQIAPQAQLAIISNPVNSLVPLTCEVYYRTLTRQQQPPATSAKAGAANPAALSPVSPVSPATAGQQQDMQASNAAPAPAPAQQTTCDDIDCSQPVDAASRKSEGRQQQQQQQQQQQHHHHHHYQPTATASCTPFHDSFRRIFGVTTLDVIRASTLVAKSALCKPLPNGLFRDPAKVQIPVVGGHAGKTIIPLLSQATPKFDRRRLLSEDKSTVQSVIESIQQAGIDVLNAKKGAGSATLAMSYAACRFTISLLRASQGEPNIIECAYVRQREPVIGAGLQDLDYFSTPLLLGKDGYVKSLGLTQQSAAQALKQAPELALAPPTKQQPTTAATTQQQQQQGELLPFEQQMIEDGARELRTSVAKGEDFAKERLSAEKA